MSLPALLRPESFPGADFAEKWKVYLDALYRIFKEEIANAGLSFRGLPIKCRYHPAYDGKHMSFWHLMSEGDKEDQRTPDLERCAHIPWIPWVIAHAHDPAMVRCWENERSTGHGLKTRIPLWFVKENYAVILERREGFYLLITGYCLTGRRAEAFEKEWCTWAARKKAEAASKAASGTPSTHG